AFRDLLAEVDRLTAELAAARQVTDAAQAWYGAGGGGTEPDGRLHRANRELRRAVAALSGPAAEPPPLADALGATTVRAYPSHGAAVSAEMDRLRRGGAAAPVPPSPPRTVADALNDDGTDPAAFAAALDEFLPPAASPAPPA